jgi:hypothetical protein
MMPDTTSVINVKEAVKTAKSSLLELYEDDPPKALALEEIDRVKDGGRELWAVTLGFFRNKSLIPAANNLTSIYLPTPAQENRVYKTVYIDATTGDFVKMDMRQVS